MSRSRPSGMLHQAPPAPAGRTTASAAAARLRRTAAAAILTLVAASTAAAQAESPCPYETCALRMEHRFSGARVVRGIHAEPVARAGLFGTSLAEEVAVSDSAVAHALRSDRARRAATLMGAISMAAGVLYVWALGEGIAGNRDETLAWGSAGVGIVTGVAAGWQYSRSLDALEQSIWWYNRDLSAARSGREP